jgi:hypothetical protein
VQYGVGVQVMQLDSVGKKASEEIVHRKRKSAEDERHVDYPKSHGRSLSHFWSGYSYLLRIIHQELLLCGIKKILFQELGAVLGPDRL